MYIEIAGIPQWIQIEEQSANNPILFLIHGGPGASTTFASAAWSSWRHHFTIVHWDQRGTGRTLAKNGPERSKPMSFDQIVMDGIEVAEYLRVHLHNRKILLLGHSWGSAIAVAMVLRRPDLFAALLATGMLVNFEANEAENYRSALFKARASGNHEALAALTEIGPPPYEDIQNISVLREWSDKLTEGKGDTPYPSVVPPSNFTPEDRKNMGDGFIFSTQQLFSDLRRIDVPSLGLEFTLPVFCLMGTDDQQTPLILAQRYFEKIKAPYKEVILFEGCHHFVHMNRPQAFLDALIHRVLPKLL